MQSGNYQDLRVLRVVCRDRKCQAVSSILSHEVVVECIHCGQKHDRNTLQDVREVQQYEMPWAVDNIMRRVLYGNKLPKRGLELVKVLGLSNYYCKLISPLLTRYGMDKVTGQAKLLKDMNQGEIFDCSLFGDRAFLIEQEHISIPGFGRDITGSMDYLSETLKIIISTNGGEERLIPIHADGDGHCLVHAISRALVGRELFWHPLRCCLKKHFENNLQKYKEVFRDFIDTDEWQSIIDECDPEFQPPDGELHGLRNIHIFGFANVLKRPIILLDSLECMQKCGDYSALFLPAFVSPEECKGKDNSLNKPLCIAWSSYSHNHYIPLVGVQKKPLPVLPAALIPKVWGMPQSQILVYMTFDSNGNCTIGGNRVLSDAYIHRLVTAMEVLFIDQKGVHPSLVADAKLYMCADNAILGTKVATVINKTKLAVEEGRLYRCLTCKALCEWRFERHWLRPGGALYNNVLQTNNRLISGTLYHFPFHGMYCNYDPVKDLLIPDMKLSGWKECTWCQSSDIWKVINDGSVIYKPEYKSGTSSTTTSCDQKIMSEKQVVKDDQPGNKTNIKLQWKQSTVEDTIVLSNFQQNTEKVLSQSVSIAAMNLILKHFPGDATNNELQAYVYEAIRKQIGKPVIPESTVLVSVANNMEKQESAVEKIEQSAAVTLDSVEDKPIAKQPEYVKVVSCNGQQANLTLTAKGVSYDELQKWIKNEFDIPISRQIIKWGFPPKELQASPDQVLPLKHGDRLVVETHPLPESNNPYLKTAYRNPGKDFRNPICDLFPLSTQTHFESKLLWNLAKLCPEKFQSKGAFYNQVKTNFLYDTMHTCLDIFPNKTFCYNSKRDAIELCVKPLGHFEINSDVDERIERAERGETVTGRSKCTLKSVQESKTISSSLRPSVSTAQDSEKVKPSLVRKGPGFSVLSSPNESENMDIS